MCLSPVARRITYVILFEAFAIALATVLLTALSGGNAHGSLPVAAASSLAAVIWNFIYNTLFERWEQARNIQTRTFALRIAHTIGFEGGLVAILIPLFMWWYEVGPIDALKMEVALLVFFLVFTFVFTWAFDRLVPITHRN
ncbi:PACE efflux transporter [Rhizobiales bacterium RZME27]|uniref:PACE efflux transporter n=2 Tax=Endobacterium cereale TaxID=2663029 RepID=A0A6A8ACF8_9HYPH|nr:PACE efflux transporter [Endobacterium cereale]